MTRPSPQSGLRAALSGMGWPLLLGAAAASLFYPFLLGGVWAGEKYALLHRYFTGHPVAYATTIMFLVGLAALTIKIGDVLFQHYTFRRLSLDRLSAEEPETYRPSDAERLLEKFDDQQPKAKDSYLGRRLRDALQFVSRQDSSSGLDEELRYLADMDAARQQESYSLSRIIIWATPMLGFLGTVIGITQALGDLDPNQLATNVQEAMKGLLAGLYVAFDTTALALSLSVGLMFLQFLADRLETELLASVEIKTEEQIRSRFPDVGGPRDPHVQAIEKMSRRVINACEELLMRQAELWQDSMKEGQKQWSQSAEENGELLQTSLQKSLEASLISHAQMLAENDRQSAERVRQRWEDFEQALSQNALAMQAHQQELIRQGQLMNQLAQTIGQTADHEHWKSLEVMMKELSTAVQILNARLAQASASRGASQGRAAA